MNKAFHKVRLILNKDLDMDTISHRIAESMKSYDKIYSFLLRVNCKNNELVSYMIDYKVADNKKYNTLSSDKSCESIICTIADFKNYSGESKSLLFKQPTIDIMIEVFDPVVKSQAIRIKSLCKQIELEDLEQNCRLCMITLYNKGYYLNKNILWNSFRNYMLDVLRLTKTSDDLISLYTEYSDDKSSHQLTLIDLIPSETEDERFVLEEKEIFQEIKELIIREVGERQFELWYRDYTNKHVSPISRKIMMKIQGLLKSKNMTREYFNNKYH